MTKPIDLHPDPSLARHSWPWNSLIYGDVVHVHGPPRILSKVYSSAPGYRNPKMPHLILRVSKVTENGKTYIRVTAADRRVEERTRAENDALVDRRLQEYEEKRAQLDNSATRDPNHDPLQASFDFGA